MSKKLKLILGGVVAGLALFALAFTASAAYMHTVTLKQGSRSDQVLALQQALNVSPATGYFGPITKAAVMAYQASNGLVADGVVGPKTGAMISASSSYYPPSYPPSSSYPDGCSSSMGYSATTGMKCDGSSSGSYPAGCTSSMGYSPMTGEKCDGSSSSSSSSSALTGEGTISDVDTLAQYTSEEVAEGQSDVKVAGFDLEASNDGNIALKSIKVTFDPTGNASGDSDHLDDYLSGVSVWLGSEKVGSADVSDFSENSNDTYSKTINLSNAVVGADKTVQIYIAVDAASGLDSGDIDSDSWTVVVNSIRYEDGTGVVSTDTTTGDLGDTGTSIGTNGTLGDGVPLSFVSFSTAADTEFKVLSSSDNPEAGIVVVSDTGTTDDVVLLKGKLELEGDSDVAMDSFLVTLSPATSTFQSMVSSIKLVVGSEEYSESVPTIAAGASATLTFDNLDYMLDAGDTVNFSIVAEIADIDDFTAGSSIVASVTATNRANFDLENEEGDQLASGERSGTAGGEAQEFRENGIKVELVGSPTAVKSAVDADNGDTALYTVKFKVTALGDNVYVASVASPDGSMAHSYSLDYSGTATTTDQTAAFENTTDATLSTAGVYEIEEGESETFELTVVRNASATDGLYRVSLTGVRWDTDDDSTPDNLYTSELDSYKTPYVALD